MAYSRSGRSLSFHVEGFMGGVLALGMVSFIIACIAAWATHVVWVIGKLASDAGATAGQIVLGAVGAFMPPVGVVHGFMIWFGIGF